MAKEKADMKAAEDTSKYQDFMKGFETATGKIQELEKNYNSSVTKLEEILKKYDEAAKKREEISAAGKKLNEGKKKEGVCPECGKDPCECDEDVAPVKRKPGEEDTKAAGASKGVTGKAKTGDKDDAEAGITGKFIPSWYAEIAGVAKKHARKEA
jgi:hypothetical protein